MLFFLYLTLQGVQTEFDLQSPASAVRQMEWYSILHVVVD